MANVGHGVEWYTADQVMSGYDSHVKNRDTCYYSIWQGKALRYGYNDGDVEEGKDVLRENLLPLVNNGNSATYTIKFHPAPDASGYITDKTPVMGSFNFKVSEPTAFRQAPPTISGVNNEDKFAKILEILMQQNQRLEALEEEEDEDEEEEDEEPEPDEYAKTLGQVKQVENLIMESPLLNDMYTHLRLGLRVLAKKFGVEPETNYQNTNYMSGVNSNEKQKDFSQIFSELLQQFPELPNLIGKLHNVMVTDNDMFRVVKKKLIDGVNNI